MRKILKGRDDSGVGVNKQKGPLDFKSTFPINVTSSTLYIDPRIHDNKTILLNRAAGIAVTLPKATGSGAKYRFVTVTTVTSNNNTIKVNNTTDAFIGNCLQSQDGGATLQMFEAAATDDTITGNGTTTGGLAGDEWIVEDVKSGTYFVRGVIAATGVEATPFSATV